MTAEQKVEVAAAEAELLYHRKRLMEDATTHGTRPAMSKLLDNLNKAIDRWLDRLKVEEDK